MFGQARGFWDARFSKEGYAYGTLPNDFVRECAARLRPPSSVLCIGDGEGRNGVYLGSLGHRVTSLDASPAGLQKARALALRQGVELRTQLADLWETGLGVGRWDVVVSVFCHLPPELRRRVHGGIARALRPGGAFILEGYTPAQLQHRTGGPPKEELLYSAELLRQELPGLRLEVCREVEREIHEGALHHGRSATVQLLGWRA